jgi:hypothetical protein
MLGGAGEVEAVNKPAIVEARSVVCEAVGITVPLVFVSQHMMLPAVVGW